MMRHFTKTEPYGRRLRASSRAIALALALTVAALAFLLTALLAAGHSAPRAVAAITPAEAR